MDPVMWIINYSNLYVTGSSCCSQLGHINCICIPPGCWTLTTVCQETITAHTAAVNASEKISEISANYDWQNCAKRHGKKKVSRKQLNTNFAWNSCQKSRTWKWRNMSLVLLMQAQLKRCQSGRLRHVVVTVQRSFVFFLLLGIETLQ